MRKKEKKDYFVCNYVVPYDGYPFGGFVFVTAFIMHTAFVRFQTTSEQKTIFERDGFENYYDQLEK